MTLFINWPIGNNGLSYEWAHWPILKIVVLVMDGLIKNNGFSYK